MNEMELSADNVAAACDRLPYSVLTALVAHLGLPSGRGGKAICSEITQKLVHDEKLEAIARLLRCFQDHILYADKILSIYYLDDVAQIDDLLNGLIKLSIPESILKNNWPNPTLEEHFSDGDDCSRLIDVVGEVDAVNLIYSSVRLVNQQEVFKPEALGKDRPSFTDDFKELIGIKSIPRQCYDSVTLHRNGVVEVRIDLYKGNKTPLNGREIEQNITYLKSSFESLAQSILDINLELPLPKDPSAAIDRFMQDEDVIIGRISQTDNQACDIGFSRRSKQDDVRDSVVFVHGNEKLREVGDQPKAYDLTARLASELGGKNIFAEIVLPSPPTTHQIMGKALKYVIIKNNIGETDYTLLLNKLMSYMES